MKIKAAVVSEKDADFEIKDDIELAEMGPDDVQVHMVASGICHTDEAVRHGDSDYKYPVILGHEGAGIVEKVGPEVTQVAVGDHVVMSYYACGVCDNCLKGHPTQCENWAVNNMSGLRPGGTAHFTENGKTVADLFDQSSFTSTTVVRERNVVKVPKDLDLRILGPLGCGYVTGSGTVLNNLKPNQGDTLAVFGTGAVGLAAMMAARIAGCTKVIGVDIVDSRLKLAKELGATDVINSKNVDAVAKIKELTGGKGVNFAVDTTGVTSVMESSIKALAQGGITATVAVTPHHMDVDPWNDLSMKDQQVRGVLMGDSIPQIDIPRLIEFYRMGEFDFDKTEKFYKFSDINQADADSKSGKTIKPVLIIDEDYKPGE
ncbi:NAD(P)-dependent alcohol dehydrogenase [Secundilactobacillus folii]|uniref:Zinc-binding dehydrogenase n=1 Tax=Secundilactobacillus folii TaxID=2678357 RepID=A0A7X3C364_9LACO|nr:NAD(P)-dependent alcohol dehydrogenase [Secundilactobacillus folii]MTV82202.1 zinc-binding dehydrogenase [Secundilactobacillus folii]